MTVSEKIRVLLRRRKMTLTELAKQLGYSRQYLTTKMRTEKFYLWELEAIAELLNCTFETSFITDDTGEKI